MHHRFAAAIGLMGILLSSGVQAFGLGEITTESRLNQPFSARIPLLSVTSEDLESVRVELASNAEFERLGVERADYLTHLRFSVQDGATHPAIIISSDRAARDPFLTFLLDVRSVNGRILREYTVLLDPPLIALAGPATPTPTSAPMPAPIAPTALPRADAAPEVPPPTLMATPVLPTPDEPESEPITTAGRYGPVQPRETLWGIATAIQVEGATVNQMIWALWTANPTAFDQGRFDGLMKNIELDVPDRERILSVPDEVARARVAELRQRRIAASTPATVQPTRPPATPGPSPTAQPSPAPTPTPSASPTEAPTTVPTAAPTTTEPLVATDPPAIVAATGPAIDATDDAESAQPDDGRVATDALAPAILDPGAEASLWGETEPDASTTASDDRAELVEDDSAAFDVDETFAPAASARPPATPQSTSGGLLDALKLPLLLLALAVIAVAGWLFARRRRAQLPAVVASAAAPAPAPVFAAVPAAADKAPSAAISPDALADQAEAAVMAAYAANGTGLPPQPPAPAKPAATMSETQSIPDFDATQVFDAPPGGGRTSPDSPDFESTAQFSLDTVQIDLDAQDPAAEADIHLAYGLFDEAALTLNNALAKDATHPEWLVKRAEVYFAAGRALEFTEAAEAAQPHISALEWQKLAVLGRQIAPTSPLFAAGNDDAALEAAAPDLIFDAPETESDPMTVTAPSDTTVPAVVDSVGEVDFSLEFPGDDSAETAADTPPSEARVDVKTSVADAPPDTNVLDFEIEPVAPLSRGDDSEPESPTIDPNSLEFNLDDFSIDTPTLADAPASATPADLPAPPTAAAPPADSPDDLLDFDFDSFTAESTGDGQSPFTESPPESPGNLIDFDLASFDAQSTPAATPPEALKADDDALLETFQLDDFDLLADSDSQAISSGDESATKLDLARAYVDMGDSEMARALLDEVLSNGNAQQQHEARTLISRLT